MICAILKVVVRLVSICTIVVHRVTLCFNVQNGSIRICDSLRGTREQAINTSNTVRYVSVRDTTISTSVFLFRLIPEGATFKIDIFVQFVSRDTNFVHC